MAGDAVKEALEVAALEVSGRMLDWDEHETPEVWPVHRDTAAAAIAAFLRALPIRGEWDVAGWEGSATGSGIWNARSLAAAVERAAQREGEG